MNDCSRRAFGGSAEQVESASWKPRQEERHRLPVERGEVLELDRVDTPLTSFASGHERLRLPQLLRNLGLGKAGV